MYLIKGAKVYNPNNIGVKDVLIGQGKIIKIDDRIKVTGVHCEEIDAKGLSLMPGFIDNHVHFLGGGGESGYASRVPEVTLKDFLKAGVTSAVGLLGTDGFTRSLDALVAKTKGLKAEGFSAYMLSGSYQMPVKTVMGSVEKDMLMIEEIIGVGEIAISDHRSNYPSLEALKQLFSQVHVAGLLSGKGGVLNIHLGSFETGLQPLIDLLDNTAVPAKKLVPTHVNRSAKLLNDAIHYSKTFQAPIDFTAYMDKTSELSAAKSIKKALDEGVEISSILMSSDGQGSLPVFNASKELVKMGVGRVYRLKAAFDELIHQGVSKEDAIAILTCNPASIYHLKGKGKIKECYDADLLLMDDSLTIKSIFMNGKHAFENGDCLVKGLFE